MASSQLISTLQEEVICPICLEILRDPVTIDCGHNFCLKCISQTEETEDNLFKCPLCNKSVKRDALRRNLLLANLVEKIEAMSPLELQPKRNELKCQKHQERYHYFCEYDGMFLCSVCCDAKEHKSHKISLTEEAARTYQERIKSQLGTLQQKAKTIVEAITQGRQKISVFSALVEKERRRIITEFDDLHRVLKEERNFLLSRLAWLSQEGAKEGSVFITSMEAQLKALNSIADTLKIRQQMSPSDLLWDIKVILHRSQEFQFFHLAPIVPELEKKFTEAKSRHNVAVETVKKCKEMLQNDGKKDKGRFVCSMNDKYSNSWRLFENSSKMDNMLEHEQLSPGIRTTEPASAHSPPPVPPRLPVLKGALPPLPLPRNRMSYAEVAPRPAGSEDTESSGITWREEVKNLTPVTLDAASAHPNLVLSHDLKTVTMNFDSLEDSEPTDPARFYPFRCVLGLPGLSSGRQAWEVELQGPGGGACMVGVASEHAPRRGYLDIEPLAGFWVLRIQGSECQAVPEARTREVLPIRPKKLGICVDHERGEVAFYDTTTGKRIYTFFGSFPGQIFPFFRILYLGTQVTLSP